MVRETKKIELVLSRAVVTWLQQNVAREYISCYVEDALVMKIGVDNLENYNIKAVVLMEE